MTNEALVNTDTEVIEKYVRDILQWSENKDKKRQPSPMAYALWADAMHALLRERDAHGRLDAIRFAQESQP